AEIACLEAAIGESERTEQEWKQRLSEAGAELSHFESDKLVSKRLESSMLRERLKALGARAVDLQSRVEDATRERGRRQAQLALSQERLRKLKERVRELVAREEVISVQGTGATTTLDACIVRCEATA